MKPCLHLLVEALVSASRLVSALVLVSLSVSE
jgi:hypothetical protein